MQIYDRIWLDKKANKDRQDNQKRDKNQQLEPKKAN
jgi:hypothetical protein